MKGFYEMIQLLNIYNDNMIFQREKPIKLCGYCSNNSEVFVDIFSGNKCLRKGKTKPKNGRWEVILDGLSAFRNLTVKVSCEKESITLSNIAIGDVWLCSGQSNIECDFNYCSSTEKYTQNFGNCDIRFLDMEQDINFIEKESLKNPEWIVLGKNNYHNLSVISCIFGQYIGEELDIPIGLVKNYRGGNSIITYLSEENIRECDIEGIFTEQLENEKKELKSAWSMIPTGFYNAMTAPLSPFSFKGMLWYQGETDSAYSRPIYYKEFLKKLIEQYRGQCNDLSLPVILVQLCPFEMDPFDFKIIRQIQLEVAEEDENVHLIVTADLGPTGEEGESAIHPKFKTPIGKRCAMAALANVYNKEMEEWSGPIVECANKNGSDLIIQFKHCGDGLSVAGEVSGFEIGRNEFFINGVKAEIFDKNKIIIKDAAYAKIVRYSYSNISVNGTLVGNIKNSVGMPASPFNINL